MSNSVKKYERYARSIGMDLEQFDELTRRMLGFINQNIDPNKDEYLTQAIIKNSFIAAPNIVEKAQKEVALKWNTTNSEMKEYGEDIAQLIENGIGCQRIKNELNLKSSRGTIEKFCRDNNLKRNIKNG